MTEPYMQPEDVPDALASTGVNAWPDTWDERPTIEDIVRHVLAEVLPEHEDTIRAKVADEIEAEYRRRESNGLAIGPLLHAADIARGQA